MNKFAVMTVKSHADAAQALVSKHFTLPVLKSGGMDVVDHLKEGLIEPDVLINLKRVRMDGFKDAVSAEKSGGGLRIEANATLAEIADSTAVTSQAPVVSQAAYSAATPQVRNVGTAAGNLLQRPRCWYYRHIQFDCLKKGGATCYAVDGENKYHAIFGDGPCHIVHPSNLAPALMVCGGVIHLTGGKRDSLPIEALFHMPDTGVKSEHTLEAGEVVTHITLKAAPKSGFYSIKEKQSFDWPLAFAAVALEMSGDKITSARVCAGAVAPVPWPLPKVEEALKGLNVSDDAALRMACAKAGDGAKPMRDNAYKSKLLAVAVRRAVLRAAGKNFEPEAMA